MTELRKNIKFLIGLTLAYFIEKIYDKNIDQKIFSDHSFSNSKGQVFILLLVLFVIFDLWLFKIDSRKSKQKWVTFSIVLILICSIILYLFGWKFIQENDSMWSLILTILLVVDFFLINENNADKRLPEKKGLWITIMGMTVIILLFIIFMIFESNLIFSSMNIENTQKNGIELREDTKEGEKHWTDQRGILDSLDSNSKGIFLYNDTVEVKAEAKDYTRRHDIEGSFGTSNNRKDEVADTKRKVQLPNEEGLADIRLFPLPEDGYIFLGIVKEKDGEKIWITRRPGNPFDVGDVFTEDYPSMKIFIEANRCNIYDDKIINNGHIVAFDTEYRVIQNIQLETRKEGDYNAWLFVELKK